ncbi:ROK family transcriptional regulator [Brachybacterium ginsengisoli]|uniref:ROK family transcriptional regulator n=1 Tax=Brachybacterium ginsengisoli TaxID=1331682 RepID=UPI00125EB98A|nr:ROK family protein [Brachybacterium ginsengisoli]
MSDASVLTAADLGAANRSRLIRILHRDGPQSRAGLAAALGVSRATVTTIVQPVLDAGLLVEQEPVQPAARRGGGRAGKPARPLWFSDAVMLGGVYVSGDGVHCAVLRMDGEVVREVRVPLAREHVAEGVLSACGDFFAGTALMGVGVAAAGMVDTEAGVILEIYRAPGLTGMAIGPELQEKLGVPVVVDHHPRVQAIGDLWFGEGRELAGFVSLHTGEVLGAGMVHRGRVLRGDRGGGGEVGHMVVDAGGERCVCGRIGCWETIATLPWLRREAERGGLDGARGMTCAELIALAEKVPAAKVLLHRYLRNIAQGIADLEQVLGLQRYLVHGDVGHGGRRVEEILAGELDGMLNRRRALPLVTAVADDDRSTLLGAAGLLLSATFSLDVDR